MPTCISDSTVFQIADLKTIAIKVSSNLSGISSTLSELGDWVDISNTIAQSYGYTPTSDGYIRICFNPVKVADAYIVLTSSSSAESYAGAFMYLRNSNGSIQFAEHTVTKGVTYKREIVVNGNAKILYRPIHKH